MARTIKKIVEIVLETENDEARELLRLFDQANPALQNVLSLRTVVKVGDGQGAGVEFQGRIGVIKVLPDSDGDYRVVFFGEGTNTQTGETMVREEFVHRSRVTEFDPGTSRAGQGDLHEPHIRARARRLELGVGDDEA